MITNLSFPPGGSVNDAIDPALCSLSYVSLESLPSRQSWVMALYSPRSMSNPPTASSQFTRVIVHYLGSNRKARFAMVCYHSASGQPPNCSPQWPMPLSGDAVVPHVAHYLDHFFILGRPASKECEEYLGMMTHVCSRMGVPLAAGKSKGPSMGLTFLGIMIDMQAGTLSLPPLKLKHVVEMGRQKGLYEEGAGSPYWTIEPCV